MTELQADFELIQRGTLEAEMSLEPHGEIDADFQINIVEKGDKGDKGDTGEQGPKGDKGETGDRGPVGPQGIQGPQGQQGQQGEKGEKGDKGDQGPQGPKGDPGANMEAVVVQTLPTTGETGKLYLVPKQTAGQSDIYEEWIWAIVTQPNTYGWEHIGSTDIDLSGYVQKTTTVNGKALSANISLTSDDIEYTTAGTNCTYVLDLFLTAMESLGDSIGGSFDTDGTFAKSSYKTAYNVPLNNISDNQEIVLAIGWCDRSIGKLSDLTTTAKTSCVSAINELNSKAVGTFYWGE